jgi:hypothetical protein
MTQLGYPPGGDPFGRGSIFSMSDHGTIERLLTGAGFSDITIEEMAVDWHHNSFNDAWEYMTEASGALAAAVKEQPASEVDELRSALEANSESFRTGSGISLPGVTINVVAA